MKKPLSETTKKALLYLVQIEGITQTYNPKLVKVDFMDLAESIGLPPEVTMSDVCNPILKEFYDRDIIITHAPDKKDKNCMYIGLRPLLLSTDDTIFHDGMLLQAKDEPCVTQVVCL